ncbi:peptidase domain-containing ABC transporter [Pedobacter sp. PF22-3]|uniref:peptidase domain-containing ABC transporter n=1 Tax=Pedobacter sp. PF22-3 TaxID=2994467 RepID=UPI0022477D53|nr:peptidase domain-containing ABC transporter [Pedobacter sp. PF22-3]MCX2494731.1 peptidase domain-containing ABC transporter [Pedobacter sp. PF22-3]
MFFKKFPIDRQLDMMDCGPSCLKMISQYWGKFYSLQYLRDMCGLTKDGVSFGDISHAAENIGLRSIAFKCTWDDLITKVPLPAIVHWKDSHFVVVHNVKRNSFHFAISNFFKKRLLRLTNTDDDIIISVADPAMGKVNYDKKTFTSKWIAANSNKGKIMVFEPQADFYERQAGEKIERLKTFENFFGYFKPYSKSFSNLLIVMLLVTILQGILPFISKAVIDVGIRTQDTTFVNILLFGNIMIVISILFSNIVRDWILVHVTSRVNIALISDYLIKLMRLPITFFENKQPGDILQRAQDHERIRSFLMGNSISMIFSSLTFTVFSIILFFYNTTIFYIFILGTLLYIFWIIWFLNIRKKLDWELFELTSKNQTYWVEVISAIQDIKLNNYEKKKRWKWEELQARLYKINLRLVSITNTQNLGAQFIDQAKNLFITFYCAKSVIAGELTFGTMISVQFIIGMLSSPIGQFLQFVVAYQTAKLSFMRINEIQQLADEHDDVGKNNIVLPENKSLIVNNLAFQYTPAGKYILQGIRILIPEKKITAIVGDSGSGKSTLLKLLLRLYKPTFGEIRIGDMNINNINLREWRDSCGAVMQDGKVFNDTILNNIILDDEKINYERLKIAVHTANIAQEIESMPLGYETLIGEAGKGLSGGQKQRLLIARALYKDPEYLFFDEATNSLDVINEQKITTALDAVFKNKTVIVVAHRLSTIRKADQIIVMRGGMVVEVGNHESLITRKGRYWELVDSQLNSLNN